MRGQRKVEDEEENKKLEKEGQGVEGGGETGGGGVGKESSDHTGLSSSPF